MVEEQNPLRRQVEKEIQESEWLGKFKAWGILLRTLKAEVPLTQLCQVRWITGSDELLIHCPNLEIRTALHSQAHTLSQLQGPASRIIIRHSDAPDLTIGPDGQKDQKS